MTEIGEEPNDTSVEDIASQWLAEDLCWQFYYLTLHVSALTHSPYLQTVARGRLTEGAACVGVADARDDIGVSNGPRGSILRCNLTVDISRVEQSNKCLIRLTST